MSWSRESRQSRGYGKEWVKVRKLVLERDNRLCQCDRCKGGEIRVTAATEVDHIVPKARGGSDDPSNLRSVSHECHKRITKEQEGKRSKQKVIITESGWPVRI